MQVYIPKDIAQILILERYFFHFSNCKSMRLSNYVLGNIAVVLLMTSDTYSRKLMPYSLQFTYEFFTLLSCKFFRL